MNVRLPVLVGVVVLGMAMVAVAGSDNAKNIVGVWEMSEKIGETKMTIEFTNDGKLKITRKNQVTSVTVEGTYKVKDATLSTVVKDGNKTIEGTTRIVKLDEKVLHIQGVKGDVSKEVDEYKRVAAK